MLPTGTVGGREEEAGAEGETVLCRFGVWQWAVGLSADK